MQNIDFNLSGGSDNTRYSFSVGHTNQEGVIRYTDFKRYSLRANVESSLGRKLRLGLLNDVRMRAGLAPKAAGNAAPTLDVSSQQAFRNAVLQERRVELAFEN